MSNQDEIMEILNRFDQLSAEGQQNFMKFIKLLVQIDTSDIFQVERLLVDEGWTVEQVAAHFDKEVDENGA